MADAQKTTADRRAAASMSLVSSAWMPGGRIPERYTADGDDVSPPLQLGNVPETTANLALIVDDPDAPDGTFTHWCAWNLPGTLRSLPEAANLASLGALVGRNDFGSLGYRGPQPPRGEEHRYVFRVFALTEALPLRGEVPRDQLEAALEGRVLAVGEYMGTYSRVDEA